MHDIVIRSGNVADGTGNVIQQMDIAIDDGLISAIGDNIGEGRTEIDASNHLVTPGFVDVHTHYDGQATWDPEMSPSSYHGVTTTVFGNCGVGFAPAQPDSHDWLIQLSWKVSKISRGQP